MPSGLPILLFVLFFLRANSFYFVLKTYNEVMTELKEKLEIIVAAPNWEDAKAKLAEVSIDEKVKITRRNINGLFMVLAQLDGSMLTDDFYQKIRDDKDTSILADSASWKRNREVLNEIYKVETELRKLLLHVLDLVEAFYDMFSKTQYAKKFANNKAVTYRDHLDPLTSRLMLGEMIEVLEFDLSWSKKDLTAANLLSLLQDVTDISELRTRLEERLKPKRPWTIISDVVLSQPVNWSEIQPKLVELKEYRNKAAHFQIVTQTEKEQVIATAKDVFSSITKQKATSAKQLKTLGDITQGYTKQLLDVSQQMQQFIDALRPSDAMLAAVASFESHNTAFAKALASINNANATALARSLASISETNTAAIARALAKTPRFGDLTDQEADKE
jgi:ligand-binding sensor protein